MFAKRKIEIPTALFGVFLIQLINPSTVLAQNGFNLEFMKDKPANPDELRFYDPSVVQPGRYFVDVVLNGSEVAKEYIDFKKYGDQTTPCLKADDVASWGIKLSEEKTDKEECVDLQNLIPQSAVSYKGNTGRLNITVPQEYLHSFPIGYISPKLYESGINAGFLNYRFSGSKYFSKASSDSEYYFASLSAGLNVGGWRLRNNWTVDYNDRYGTRWKSIRTWAEKDFPSIRSRVLLGNGYTNGGVFDSVGFRGVSISSAEDMLPYSQRSYAPTIRGVANTEARVEIRQDGNLIYATNVTPGPFVIDDITPNRLSGALEVSVIEADGSIQRYRQEFSAAAIMLRPGIWNYQVTAGQLYQGRDSNYRPGFLNGYLAYGLDNSTTPYASVTFAENYNAGGLGIGLGLGQLGAISMDMSVAQTKLALGTTSTGQSYRLIYSKFLNDTGTDFRIVGQRFSTSGYYDFSEAAAEREQWRGGYYEGIYFNDSLNGVGGFVNNNYYEKYTRQTFNSKKNKLDISVTQRINDKLFLNLGIYNQTFWRSGEQERTLQLSLNGRFKETSYGLYVLDNRNKFGIKNRVVGFNVQIPFETESHHRINSSSSVSHSDATGHSVRTGLDGRLFDDRLGYYLGVGDTETGGANSSANIDWSGSKGTVSAGIYSDKNNTQLNVDVSGGALLHSGGVTLGREIQYGAILIKAPEADGVGVENYAGVEVDASGYAYIPGVTAYRFNRVALALDKNIGNLNVNKSKATVVPTKDAIVQVEFDTRRGSSYLISSTRSDGKTIPIGSGVFNEDGNNRGVVGDKGEIFINSVKSGEKISVSWGDSVDQTCKLFLDEIEDLNLHENNSGFQRTKLVCHMNK